MFVLSVVRQCDFFLFFLHITSHQPPALARSSVSRYSFLWRRRLHVCMLHRVKAASCSAARLTEKSNFFFPYGYSKLSLPKNVISREIFWFLLFVVVVFLTHPLFFVSSSLDYINIYYFNSPNPNPTFLTIWSFIPFIRETPKTKLTHEN